MKQKIPSPINIPKDKKVQFEDVPFVEGMSLYSLKVLVKRYYCQLMALANIMEGRRSDIPTIIDRITGGTVWSKKDIQDRYQYGFHKDFIIQFDTLERKFVLLDEQRNPIGDPIFAISASEGKEFTKEQRSNS